MTIPGVCGAGKASHAKYDEQWQGLYAQNLQAKESERLKRGGSGWNMSDALLSMCLSSPELADESRPASAQGGQVSLAKPAKALKLRRRNLSQPLAYMRDLNALSDQDLVEASLEGDLGAFDEIVRRHQSMITRCLFRFCPYQADLEDLVQDTFIKSFRKLSSWQATAPFENWLRKIAYNTGYDYFRKNSRNPAAISTNNTEESELALERLSEKSDQRRDYEMTEQAQKALALLREEDRYLLTLQYLEDLSLAEIAAQMGWGLSKTKVKSFRARKKLKQLLIKNGIAQETDVTHVE